MREGPTAVACALALVACSSPAPSGGSDGGAAGDDATRGGTARPATQATGRFFPDEAPWYRDVTTDPVSPDSASITAWMVAERGPGGFGLGRIQIDFGLAAFEVPGGTPRWPLVDDPDAHYEPDCDRASIPLPPGGLVEASDEPADLSGPFTGYACGGFDDGADCHLLLVSREERRLYEVYRATVRPGERAIVGGCLAIWDTSRVYGAEGRGLYCTSADAAGLPMAPLVFTPEEVRSGVIDHAIRFTLPNDMIRARKFVPPATHGTSTTGPATSIPYGARLRLRADYPVDSLAPAAQVVARALQKYGMIHADGGNVALTAQSDAASDVKWADLGLEPRALAAIRATDFDVLDFGAPLDVGGDCARTPIDEP